MAHPEKYWHCQVQLLGQKKSAVVNDLTFRDLQKQIVEPWHCGAKFPVAGLIVNNRDEVQVIKITHTDRSQPEIAAEFNAESRANGVVDMATNRKMLPVWRGTDHTHELLFADLTAGTAEGGVALDPADSRGAHMNIILTWSQKGSHAIALYLREWLVEVVPTVKPWVSSEDIQKGKKWFPELMAKFGESRVSITCITPENVNSPWVYYEVGLIAARQDEGIVCPYLVGVAGKHIRDTPLAEFQWTEADKSDTWKLIKSINKELKEHAFDEKVLEGNFNSRWPRLKAKLENLIGEMGEVEDDVTQVVQARRPTLREPAKQLLMVASKDPSGTILALRTSEGYHFQTNKKDLVGSHDPKLIAKWKGALDELRGYGYVEDRGHKGEVFSLTDIGYEYVAELEANDPILSLSDEAKQLLASGADSDDGLILLVENDAGFQILADAQQFVPMNKPAEAANWKHALDQLRQRNFVEETGDDGAFRVTKAGHDATNNFLE